MNHLSNEQVYLHVLNEASLTEAETMHLSTCPPCRQQLAAAQRMVNELAITRRSQPLPAALNRYFQLFDQVQRPPNPLQALVQRLRAELRWDSRQQSPSWQGVRSAGRKDYRLLYMTEYVTVEMMVTPNQTQFEVDGELISNAPQTWQPPALIQLKTTDQPTIAGEAECNSAGRFRLEHVTPGNYTMLITPPIGSLLEIEGLDIT
jgi:hypothetical protein